MDFCSKPIYNSWIRMKIDYLQLITIKHEIKIFVVAVVVLFLLLFCIPYNYIRVYIKFESSILIASYKSIIKIIYTFWSLTDDG